MVNVGVVYDSATAAVLWKKNYHPKCSWPIRLQDFLNPSISGTSWGVKLIFGFNKVDIFTGDKQLYFI